ncbi:BgTH12-00061 [Blumeria graminis f. sp. triticale]|uniref:BgtASP-20571 n=3 Tax=Blumeria graminis TaxID=34373 RepID=A0A9X9MLD7_BLUGR|nr:hypothetical protein BGT96224_ASP20571 [Blumeria graminis f. sp. tritici 96224]CAD6504552.1 BgTH12-00061 [Blumeria graminis f. sp. triticale]VDB92525.1 BgtASP-20571 [Blumeria graminis f. sp. tritici]
MNMQFLMLLVFMVTGLIAMPIGPYIVSRTNIQTTGKGILEKMNGINFHKKGDALENNMSETIESITDLISTMSTTPIGKQTESAPKISALAKNLTHVMSDILPGMHAKRCLQ